MIDTMQYRTLTDETALIVGENGESELYSSSFRTNRMICRLRKCILIFLLIQLSLCAVLLMTVVRLFKRNQDDNRQQAMRSLVPVLISIIYYGFGFGVVYRYYHLGIYIFCWLGFLQYTSVCVEMFLNILSILKHTSQNSEAQFSMHMSLIITIISAKLIALMVVTLKLAFKINRTMKIFQREVIEQL